MKRLVLMAAVVAALACACVPQTAQAADRPLAIQVANDLLVNAGGSATSSALSFNAGTVDSVTGYMAVYVLCVDNTAGTDADVTVSFTVYDPASGTYIIPRTAAGAADNEIIHSTATMNGASDTTCVETFTPPVTQGMKIVLTGHGANEATTTCDAWVVVQ